jgi:hypothetical protein
MKNIFVRKGGQLLVQQLVVLLLFFQILKDLSTPLASAPIWWWWLNRLRPAKRENIGPTPLSHSFVPHNGHSSSFFRPQTLNYDDTPVHFSKEIVSQKKNNIFKEHIVIVVDEVSSPPKYFVPVPCFVSLAEDGRKAHQTSSKHSKRDE